MLTATRRILIGASYVALAAAAGCGGSPTRPSGASGASVAGSVYMGGAAPKGIHAISGPPAAGLVVTIEGTNLSATVEPSGYFQIAGVPSGRVRLQFKAASVDAATELANVGPEELVEIQVEVTASTATIVNEVRSVAKVSLCHSTGNGSYHLISVSDSAEPAHRDHGDAKVGEPVPGQSLKVFDQTCRAVGPSIEIKKSTNGEDADSAPGPRVIVGSPVTWQYVVTNTGTVELTSVMVVDDRNVTVSCPATTLAVGGSMTCTGSGVATLGQYRNVGTVTAASASGSVTDSDVSHYLGRLPEEEEPGAKVKLCHKTGNGRYQPIEVSVSAEPAHRAHGDGQIGEPVPDQAGKVFGAACAVN
jgi:hypothetical protein